MAGIGNYIHYWYSNYEKYGITQKGNGKAEAIALIQQQKQALISKVKSGNKNYLGLENALNNLIYPMAKEDANAHDSEPLRQKTEALMGEMALKWITNWEQGGSSYNKKLAPEGQGFHMATLMHLKLQVESILKMLSNSSNANSLEARKNSLKAILKQIDLIEKEASQILGVGKNQDYYYLETGRMKNLINSLNESLNKISSASRLTAIGTNLEAAIATLDDRLVDKIENYSYDFIQKEIMTGSSSAIINGAAIDQNFLKDFSLFDGSKGKISLTGKLETNNMKMDVNLIYNNENFRISAKNYSMLKDSAVHIISSSPFLNILQKNTSANFINHYLNILVSRDNRFAKRNNADLQKAHELAKTMIIIEGLTGISQKQGYADTLVINNRSKRRIIVRPMSYFVKPLKEDLFKITGYDLDSDKKYNKWSTKSKEDRIGTLLIDLHKIKISASLNTNNFWS